jgi:hypothetical protein
VDPFDEKTRGRKSSASVLLSKDDLFLINRKSIGKTG